MGNNSPRPGVVVASKFIFSTNDAFSKYVEYIDREEAIRNEEFSNYDAFHLLCVWPELFYLQSYVLAHGKINLPE